MTQAFGAQTIWVSTSDICGVLDPGNAYDYVTVDQWRISNKNKNIRGIKQ